MKYNLKNKKILITGAASGIGKALTLECVKHGAFVLLLDRDKEELMRLEGLLKSQSAQFHTYAVNLVNFNELEAMCKTITSTHGAIDILINCAGREINGLTDEVPQSSFQENFDLNFNVPLILTQKFLPGMKEQRTGQIINLSSGMGRRAVPGKAAYCASKFALNALTESLRLEVAPYNIHVMMVSPGPCDTNIVKNSVYFGRLKQDNAGNVKRKHPSDVAKKIVRGIQKKSRVVKDFSLTEVFIFINYFFPKLADKILIKMTPVPGPTISSGSPKILAHEDTHAKNHRL